jgi:hypothetical protein
VLRTLIADQQVLSLAVLVDRKPVLGLLPYAPLPDFSAVLVHASALARHTQGLRPGTPFAILIHDRVDDPLQVVRVSASKEKVQRWRRPLPNMRVAANCSFSASQTAKCCSR